MRKFKLLKSCISLLCTIALIPTITFSASAKEIKINNPVVGNGVTTWDCIYFGSYEQDNKTSNGKEAIKWRVLNVSGTDAFVVSDAILDAKPYNTTLKNVTWETCTLRSWLNGYDASCNVVGIDYSSDNFMDAAFNANEQAAIKVTTVSPDPNPYYATNQGNATNDKVYLLSISETGNASFGFSTSVTDYDDARSANNTTYAKASAKAQQEYSSTKGKWWLRSLSVDNCYSTYVYYHGEVLADGAEDSDVRYVDIGVRPALHINLESDSWRYAGTVSSDGTVTEPCSHVYATSYTVDKKATLDTEGSKSHHCTICDEKTDITAIACPKTFTLAKTAYEFTGTQVKPDITIKDTNGKSIAAANYTVTYGANDSVGKGSLTVKFKGEYSGTKTVEFKINPPKPAITEVTNTDTGIKVKWGKITEATAYAIYRRDPGETEFVKVKNIPSNATVSWTDTSATVNGGKYTYKVRAIKTVDGKDYKSDKSTGVVTYYVSAPTGTSVSSSSTAGKISVKWAKNSKATGYVIQYSTSSSYSKPTEVKVTSASTVSKAISGLKSGQKYYVRIKAYKTVGSDTAESAWTKIGSATAK